MRNFRYSKGFSLMELMVAVVIVGILAAIAYPAYTDYINRTRRADGKAALLNMAIYMEHYYTENNSYTGATVTGIGLTNASSQEGYYTLSISALTGTSYTLTATPTGAQAADSCGALTLTNTNVKGPNSDCWQR
ncbi:type IV pilin protein [Candidatus Berkiella aquae]|uniref:Fimbrial protein n=1 Tax=Candidatus Berkiella aquae TaxID=295108 RepID=A0A0Q9YNC6_9GAMM|nr:type IV pilin protein [Candidatus Berkiella aquae]MCS5712498.1 type IV pilin protein [Candidatus Berkiella aquae]